MTLDVSLDDSMADVLSAVQEVPDGELTLRIRDESSLFLTANEFRALSLVAGRSEVELTIESSDPLRRQLAAMFNIPLAEASGIEMPDNEALDEIDGGFESDLLKVDDEDRELSPDDLPPAQQSEDVTGTDDEALASSEEGDTERDERPPGRWGRIAAGIFLGIVAIVAGLLSYWWFFSTATVELTLIRIPVETNLQFSVSENGSTNDVATIPGQSVSFDLAIPMTGLATGVETTGETAAVGELVLRNPSVEEIEIPSGASFVAFNGLEYVFPESVTVPAVLPDGSAGETTATIESVVDGSSSNADVGMLSGQLDNGVYYSNRLAAVGGGTDREVSVVTQEDLDQLEANALETLRQLAVTSELSGGLRIVPSTLDISSSRVEFDRTVGEEASEVAIEATATFEGLAFPTDSIEASAADALSGQIPAGTQVDSDSIQLGVPVETGAENGSRSLIVPVTGNYVQTLTTEQIASILAGIEGVSEDDAVEQLESLDAVEEASIMFSPSWMPHRVPNSADRIDLEEN